MTALITVADLPARIEVTAAHIAEGKQSACFECPIALAIAGKCPGGLHVAVRIGQASLYRSYGSGCLWTAALPEAASEFIKAFDRGAPVEPLTFELQWKAFQ
jgi:hypothetical protein